MDARGLLTEHTRDKAPVPTGVSFRSDTWAFSVLVAISHPDKLESTYIYSVGNLARSCL